MYSLRWHAGPSNSTCHCVCRAIGRRSRTTPGVGVRRSLIPDSPIVRSTARPLRVGRTAPVFAVAYASEDLRRIRRTSRLVGRGRLPLRHGVRMATGSTSSISSHTAGSSALSEPWWETLNADAVPNGRASSSSIFNQPRRSRSAPSSTAMSPTSTRRAMATSFGERLGILVSAWPALGSNGDIARMKSTNASSEGESAQMRHNPCTKMRRLATAHVGTPPASRSLEIFRYSNAAGASVRPHESTSTQAPSPTCMTMLSPYPGPRRVNSNSSSLGGLPPSVTARMPVLSRVPTPCLAASPGR